MWQVRVYRERGREGKGEGESKRMRQSELVVKSERENELEPMSMAATSAFAFFLHVCERVCVLVCILGSVRHVACGKRALRLLYRRYVGELCFSCSFRLILCTAHLPPPLPRPHEYP